MIPTHHIQAGGYGVALGIVCSLAAYITWFCCQCNTQENYLMSNRVRPTTERPTSVASNDDNSDHSLSKRSTPSMKKGGNRLMTSTPINRNVYAIPGTMLNVNTPDLSNSYNSL